MSMLSWFNDYLIHRSNEKSRERDHEIRLEELRREEIRESNICQSCESLKLELARLHDQNNNLIAGILKKPEETTTASDVEIKQPKRVPWNVRRQMLETEDRAQAKILNQQKETKPIASANGYGQTKIELSTEDLERELAIGEGK